MNTLKLPLSILILMLLAAGFVTFTAKANPLSFAPGVSTATATTSVTYMTPGTATTTLSYDTYVNGNTAVTNEASLLVQLDASSTASELHWTYEFSQDNVDWYSENVDLTTNATTTTLVRDNRVYSWVAPAAGVSRKLVTVPTPTRYVRVVFTLPVGSGNASLWAELLPQKERPE